jgi:AcrR family transcriptional regulator
MVACVAVKGYERTAVADLLELSGVSRRTFYERFPDKEACFVAAVSALIGNTIALVTSRIEQGTEEERARAAFDTFVELIVAQPAAARMCFVDIYGAGPTAVAVVDEAMRQFESFIAAMLEQMPGRAGMPPLLVRAMIGGMRAVIHARLYRNREAELPRLAPAMMDWALAFEKPPRTLRRGRRRSILREDGSHYDGGPLPAQMPLERIVRGLAAAVAEKGYAETRIADIAAAAHISQATFYAHFKSKEDALLATLEMSGVQMMAGLLPAVRRTSSWPEAVRVAIEYVLAFLAAEPDFAWLRSVEIYAAGPHAVNQRDRGGMQFWKILIEQGEGPEVPTLVQEMTIGALLALSFEWVRNEGPENMPAMASIATYTVLAPLLGAETACTVANGEAHET